MFSPALQELRSLLGRGFLLGVFFPLLIVVTASLLLYFEITEGEGTALAAWETLPTQIQVLSLLIGLIVVVVLASLIYNFQFMITRLFEGYWPWPLKYWRKKRTALHIKRWQYFDEQRKIPGFSTEQAEVIEKQLSYYSSYTFYPEKMMPTLLGNILSTSEVYPYSNYGVDAPIIWTRLYPLLDKTVLAPLENSRTTMDFMLLMSVLSLTFSLVWCSLLILFTNRWDLFLLCSLGWPVAWICYHNAVQTTLNYSEQLKAIFDLHRLDLLKALGLPTDAKFERILWEYLRKSFYENEPMPVNLDSFIQPAKPQNWDRVANALANLLEKMKPPTF